MFCDVDAQSGCLEDVTAALTSIKNPVQQLLSATSRAEKFLKTAIEGLKKTELKAAAEARKPKKPDQESIALFDQGIEKASAIPRRQLGQALEKTDIARPFIFQANEWVSDLLQEGSASRTQFDDFKVAFDGARAKQKGVRLSKAFDGDAARDAYANKVASAFNVQGTDPEPMIPEKNMSAALKPHLATSFFAVDAGYDKVSGEGLGFATLRLCLSGTRQVVMTEMLQLRGFMERKGVGGVINSMRLSAFLRHMTVPLLGEYVKECTLWASTVGAGDVLYTPYGFLQGELVSQMTLGLRSPLLPKGRFHTNALVAAKARKAEMEAHVSGETTFKDKATVELPLLQEIIRVMSENSQDQASQPSALPAASQAQNSDQTTASDVKDGATDAPESKPVAPEPQHAAAEQQAPPAETSNGGEQEAEQGQQGDK